MSGWFSISTIAVRVCAAGLLALALTGVSVGGASAKVYEMVSPVDKNGVDAMNGLKVAADGSAVAWTSIGSYAGGVGFNAFDAYIGRHQPDGSWHTTPLYPKATDSIRPGLPYRLGGMAFSADLTKAAVMSLSPLDPADLDGASVAEFRDIYQLSPGRDNAVWASKAVDGPNPNAAVDARLVGVSADGSSIFFTTSERLSSDATGGEDLYRWRDDGPTELVGRGTDGTVLPGGSYLGPNATVVNPGNGTAGDLPDSIAVSADGKTFVYGSGGSPKQLYLHRPDGSVTLLSASQATATRGAPAAPGPTGRGPEFLAALPDFSVVYFSSEDQLTDDAPVGGGDYAYGLRSGKLQFSNIDDNLTNLNGPRGFIRASDDGRYVYFGSTRGLALGGTVGEFNLYVSGPSGTRFVSNLNLKDQFLSLYYGKSPLFTPTGLSADGTKFVFRTVERATAYDNAGTAQVYVYDAVTDRLRCVSCNPFTARSTGGADLSNSSDLVPATPRSISADGRQIVFVTSEGLVPEDTNGVQDVYQDVDGTLSLLSTGTSSRNSKFLGMSVDGSVKFIGTASSLVAQDIDHGLADVYAVREGDPAPPAAVKPACAGDDCQGPATARVGGTGAAGSMGLNTTRGNAQPVKRTVPKAKKKAVRCKKGYVKKSVRGVSRCVKKKKAVSRSQKSSKFVNSSRGSK